MRDITLLAIARRFSRLCVPLAAAAAIFSPGRAHADAFPDSVFGSGFEACSGLECAQVHCPDPGITTSISGTVFAPNGTLPLPNVEVYVPNATLSAFVDGPNAPRCDQAPSGHPLVATLTDASGNFTLKNMPATTNVPVVLLAGKWRRQITVASVPQCTNTALSADATRLPRNHTEGDIAHIAVVTGASEALECLMRKSGVVDSEFSTNSGSGRIHLFAGTSGNATNHFDLANGGATFASASTLWASSATLAAYDQVMLACDGSQNPGGTISAAALSAMTTYANAGGRVYLSHFQNYWIASAAPWSAVAAWNSGSTLDSVTAQVNAAFPQAAIMYEWLSAVGASATPGTLAITSGRQTAIALDESLARKWIYLDTTVTNLPSFQYFTFTTPVGVAPPMQDGRVLFTEMHSAIGDSSASGTAFPSGGCNDTLLTILNPQDRALLYGIFDLQRCVGSTLE